MGDEFVYVKVPSDDPFLKALDDYEQLEPDEARDDLDLGGCEKHHYDDCEECHHYESCSGGHSRCCGEDDDDCDKLSIDVDSFRELYSFLRDEDNLDEPVPKDVETWLENNKEYV